MSLKKLFNFKYFKENIKKSKGLLAFIFGIIPLVNILFLIISLIAKEYLVVFNGLSALTFAGIFVLPLILSIALFGFVFKRKNVDFVMSGPLSRKSIYITNALGGLGLIVLFIFINALVFTIFGLFTELIIPISLIIDYFVYWCVAYIFMFSVATLAITLAGNFIASVVLMLIITLFGPFLLLVNDYMQFHDYSGSYISCNNEECKPLEYYCYNDKNCLAHLAKNEYRVDIYEEKAHTFTMPIAGMQIFNINSIYNILAIFKMSILSIIYLIIGLFTFKRRKMENNETSFKNEFAHYFVKTITFIPACFIGYMFVKEMDIISFLITLVVLFIYYIVYDLITKKEIYKFFKSLLIFLISVIGSFGIYAGIDYICNDNEAVIKDVSKISFDYQDYGKIDITDKSLINVILKNIISDYREENDYGIEGTLVENKKKYNFNIGLTKELESLINKYLLDNDYKKISYDYGKINAILLNGWSVPISDELIDLLKKADLTTKENSLYNYKLYIYKNHDYQVFSVPCDGSKELKTFTNKYLNELFIEKLDADKLYGFGILNNEDKELEYTLDYVIKSNYDDFKKYLKQHINDEYSSDAIIIRSYSEGYYDFVINDSEGFRNEFKKYIDNVKDTEEYQRLIEFCESEYEFQD